MPNNESELRKLIHKADQRSYCGRLERLKFLFGIEKQSGFPAPPLAVEYYEEARLCWYVGAFVATILMTQLAFEELMRSHYRVVKGVGGKLIFNKKIKKVDDTTFFDLIEAAKNDKWISKAEANELHNLRKNIRNPYVHVKNFKISKNGKPNLKKPNFFIQYLKIKAPELIRYDVEDEAKDAIKILVILFPLMSLRYGGSLILIATKGI